MRAAGEVTMDAPSPGVSVNIAHIEPEEGIEAPQIEEKKDKLIIPSDETPETEQLELDLDRWYMADRQRHLNRYLIEPKEC